MRTLLEIREKMKLLYSRGEFLLVPVWKFMMAYLVLCMVNGNLGYMAKLDNLGLVLVVSLFCSFLPGGSSILFAAVFSLMHLYALSLEVAVVAAVVFLIMILLFARFSAGHASTLILTVLLLALKIPYVIPIAVGLLATPMASIPMGCGIIVYYFLKNISGNATILSNMGADEAISKVRLAIDGIIENKGMMVMIVAFVITICVVYVLKRLSVEYAWTIAMVSGVIVDLVILLIGDLLYDTNLSLGFAIFGSFLTLGIAKIIEFFRFCVDYSRTEKVQYEDDEYYYYVKAVPKMSLAATEKTVKKINAQRVPPATEDEERPGRRVVTERTRGTGTGQPYRQEKMSGKSVTISSQDDDLDYLDDYDE